MWRSNKSGGMEYAEAYSNENGGSKSRMIYCMLKFSFASYALILLLLIILQKLAIMNRSTIRFQRFAKILNFAIQIYVSIICDFLNSV